MVYAVDFPEPDTAVEWRLTDDGAERSTVTYRPQFYVTATEDRSLDRVAEVLGTHPDVTDLAREQHRPNWRDDTTETLAVEVARLAAVQQLASTVAQVGRPGAYRCFNVDFTPGFRYCLERDVDPTPARTPTVLSLATPPPTFAEGLSEVTVTKPDGDEERIEGDSEAVARRVERVVAETNPDVLSVSTGELIPTLFDAVGDAPLQLGREPGYTQLAGASTYESYGKVGHSPARYNVPGRPIVDQSNAFFLTKTNIEGLLDLVERSRKPLQEASWASIGNVLTAIQIRKALARDVLVPWRAWRPEFFKSARTLEAADRGGHTFSPDVGVHEDVHELDFASLYPSIMCTRNISPETVCCDCHPESEDVPGLGYNICPEDGYLPDVLQPLVDARDGFKDQLAAAAGGDGDDPEAAGPSAAIKWILVSCFGYQGFSNAKFGRIECHEAINAFAREILLDAKETFERHGWRVVHGIVDSLWVTAVDDREQTDLDTVAAEITEEAAVRLEYEAAYDWIAFCPRRNDDVGALNRYFGKQAEGPLKVRGIEARQRSTPPFVEAVQRACLERFDASRSPEAVVDRLRTAIRRLRAKAVPVEELVTRNRVSKSLEEYSRRTRNVAALERADAQGLDVPPGADVEFVVVDDERDSRERVALAHEEIESYDAAYYEQQVVRAVESVLSPLGWDEADIRRELSGRQNAVLRSFGGGRPG